MAKPGSERPARVRAFKPKVSTGCKTCKIRRVKCDEAKPSCKRCSSTGRKCDGYFYCGVPSSTTPRLLPPTNNTRDVTTTNSTIDVCPSLNFLDSNLEQRSFSFFHQNTIPQLSSIFGSPSWKQLNRLLLQAVYHEPAVRHAAVALGALHEQFELNSRPHLSQNEQSLNTQFAVQQYVKALGYLVSPAKRRGKPAADVALITCILFVCFENLRGEYAMALSHINGGVKIIEEIAQTSSTPISPDNSESSTPSPPVGSLEISQTPYVPLSTLSLIFIEFDVQASGLVSNRTRALSARKFDMPSSGYGPDIPTLFKSVDEACLALDYIRTHGIRMLDAALRKKNPPDLAEMRVTLDLIHSFSSIRLKQWSQAFEAFLTRNPHSVNDRGVLMLKMHRVFMGVNTAIGRMGLIADETIFDQFLPQFKIVVELCEKIVAVEAVMDRPRPIFCLDTGIVICLFAVISKCRDGETRWKAHDLMTRTDRQEGLYHSRLAGLVAKRIIEIEEEGLVQPVSFADLPNSKRLAGVEVEFDYGHKGGTVWYIRRPLVHGPPGPGEVIVEYVEW
ncbi:hypothetical protein ONS95_006901 [Cadophora gregata]|uniref:uncharacterized protein n=1 Tax=Cadophora gregata TaxID=51156 RepID=UPI0026DC5DB5|nr:uncharacterized protein ONS95_006901 [Cadophora gregata]KAK0101749.1 hypothetical protein ONS95_006901 [Cadophora gregata]